METSAALRSFHCSSGSISRFSPDKAGLAAWTKSHNHALAISRLAARQANIVVSCAKAPEATVSSKFDGDGSKSSKEKHGRRSATFPNVFEALILEVCDETSVAELQLKVGDFEMHLKRKIGGTNAPIAVAPPVPTEPIVQSTPATPSTSSEKASPFANAGSALSSKVASLEASGIDGFKLVTSPTVGSFRRGRTVKGKKQPPICKQGDIIKEGQVIGYIDQFGTELPVKSDVAGEVLKLLFDEGDAVGYGDPVLAVLPSFHGLN